jgi:hypothetical protein
MNTMKAKYLLPLLAMSVAATQAGERESFDFGWKFKYCGSGSPAEAGVPVSADSFQGTHPAAHAVDGNLMTRWCAKNSAEGHYLEIRPGVDRAAKMAVVYWEQRNNMLLEVKVDYGDSVETRSIRVGHQAATFIRLKEKPVR